MSARESLARLLAEHPQVDGFDEVGVYHKYACACSWTGDSDAEHRAHVADAILAAGWTPPRTSNPDSHEWLGMDR